MKKSLKSLYSYLKKVRLIARRKKAFEKRYRKYNENLFRRNVDARALKKYKEKWRVYGRSVEVETFILCHNLSGRIDYNIVPEHIFAAIIERKLNPHPQRYFFQVKNVYEKWFQNCDLFPKSFFHKIDGIYYDEKLNLIKDVYSFIENANFEFPMIFKPSKDTYGGAGVRKVSDKSDLINRIDELSNFVCQELISQSEYLAKVNNSSVNSVRCCLYRDSRGNFNVINNSMRFGVNGGLDNETAGGIVCYVCDDGSLNDYAVDKYGNKFFEHPNSRIKFSSIKLPFYENLNSVAVAIASEIPFCNLISLDLCLDVDEKWRCIEINLSGQTIRFPQYAGVGFFGRFTDEVIAQTSGA